MRVHWEILEANGERVEAQVWRPDESSQKLILFCPGFPGMGAGLFEQRHAAALAEAGYDLAVLRHKGTRLDAPSAPLMVNNAARLMRARAAGERIMGGQAARIAEWLTEPLTALQALGLRYESIRIIGNSFGALSCLWSLTQARAPLEKISHILLLAGAQGVLEDDGKTDIMRIWQPQFIADPRITEKVALEDPAPMIATIRDTYAVLPARVAALPGAIAMTALVVAHDEILRPVDAEKFNAAVGGRIRMLVDEGQKACLSYNLIAHDTPDLRTETLLEIFGK